MRKQPRITKSGTRLEDLDADDLAKRRKYLEGNLSAEEEEEAVRGLEEAINEYRFQQLVTVGKRLGVPFNPSDRASFFEAMAFKLAEREPEFGPQQYKSLIVWDDIKLAELAADAWDERNKHGGSDRVICSLLTQPGGLYSERWGGYSAASLRTRLTEARQSRLVRLALERPDYAAEFIRRFGLFGKDTK